MVSIPGSDERRLSMSTSSTAPSRQHVIIPISGFGCLGSGALIIERALAQEPGVIHAYVNPATEMAYVQYDADRCTPSVLRAVIAHAGFHAGEPVAS